MKRLLSILLLVFAFSYLGFAADVTLDMFEYATDDSAQAEYVSSGGSSLDLCTGGTITSSTEASPVEGMAQAFDDDSSTRWRTTSATMPQWIQYQLSSAKKIYRYTLTSGGDVENRDPDNWTLEASNTGAFGGEEVTVDTRTSEASGWTSRQQKRTFDCDNPPSVDYIYYRLIVTATRASENYLQITEIEMMEANLQCYSEDTIKQQGSYSLKGIALITDSLNDTLTRTVDPTIDLTDKTSIKYDIYSASRTGSQIKIGIHDSGGTTSEHTANISSTGAWETQTWDISGVSNANKDAIDSIIVTVVNADAANTFYIDNFYGTIVAVDHPTTSQLLLGGIWFKNGVKQYSDWTRFKRGTTE